MTKEKLKKLRCKAWGITEVDYQIKQCGDFTFEDMYRAYRRGERRMTKEQIKEKAKDFVSKIAGGTSKEMDYYANILAEFATEVTKELETSVSNLRKDNKELREVLPKLDKENDELKYQLTKAKDLLERLLITSCNSDVLNLLPNCSEVLRVRVEAEQFLKYSEVEK